MKKKTLSPVYLSRPPKTAIAKPPLLVLLHGYGSNESDLFSFADELPDELLVISLRAPISLDFGGYAWYDIYFDRADKFSNTEQALAAYAGITDFIDNIIGEAKVNADNVSLMGFSQGAVLSYAVALNFPGKIKNTIALSGYIDEALLPRSIHPEDYSASDFFISHGSDDQIIPVTWARKAPQYLNQYGISNQYKEYPVGHGVSPQNFRDVKQWIAARL